LRCKPTLKIAANAKLGLQLRDEFGRGGTDVGVRRAQGLAKREELEPADIKSMYSYFARHEVDKQTTRHRWGSRSNPSAGYIAWLLWGGEDGKRWVGKQRSKLSSFCVVVGISALLQIEPFVKGGGP
jgi:hypothetical protein